jgi:hypothetical protein
VGPRARARRRGRDRRPDADTYRSAVGRLRPALGRARRRVSRRIRGRAAGVGATAPHLLLDIDGGIARLTLNRPDKRNALSPEMVVRLAEAWQSVAADPVGACPGVGRAGALGPRCGGRPGGRSDPGLRGAGHGTRQPRRALRRRCRPPRPSPAGWPPTGRRPCARPRR